MHSCADITINLKFNRKFYVCIIISPDAEIESQLEITWSRNALNRADHQTIEAYGLKSGKKTWHQWVSHNTGKEGLL